jgi:Na+/H+ antiporter NhaD/arsenite permease-like protein
VLSIVWFKVIAISYHLGPGNQISLFRNWHAIRGLSKVATVVIFATTYFAVAIGRLPGFKVDRAGAAFLGASLMIAAGLMPLAQAYRAIDFDTITLLLGVMVVVANLRLSGLLTFFSRTIIKHTRRPPVLLSAIVLFSGLLSAFLVNDTICLAVTPLILDLVLRAKRDPIPYMLAVAMASNVGSVATITGNPQNMIIGTLSHISYSKFAQALSPIAGVGLLLTVLLIMLAYPSELWCWDRLDDALPLGQIDKAQMIQSGLTSAGMIIAFFAGMAPARAAIAASAVLLLNRRIECGQIFQEIQWTLLLMFAGLFIVIAGLEQSVLTRPLMQAVGRLHLENVAILSVVTATLSNLVSNVPAVLALKPFASSLPDQQTSWLTIAMASTLAGNFTLLGSVANLIVAELAERRGVTIRFWEYFKVGAPLTVLTIALGLLWLNNPVVRH